MVPYGGGAAYSVPCTQSQGVYEAPLSWGQWDSRFRNWSRFVCSGHGEGRGKLGKKNRSAQEYQAKGGRNTELAPGGLVCPSVKEGAGDLGVAFSAGASQY